MSEFRFSLNFSIQILSSFLTWGKIIFQFWTVLKAIFINQFSTSWKKVLKEGKQTWCYMIRGNCNG